jgi:micrococcal nuclease
VSRVFSIAGLLLVTASAAIASPCPRGALTGQVTHVRDGDTIVAGTMPIRLNGLAAPEGDEPGGDAATRRWSSWSTVARSGASSTVSRRTTDASESATSMVWTSRMVRQGFARDCPRFSGGRYRVIEAGAAEGGATIGHPAKPCRRPSADHLSTRRKPRKQRKFAARANDGTNSSNPARSANMPHTDGLSVRGSALKSTSNSAVFRG